MRGPTVNSGSSATCTTSLAERNCTPMPSMLGTQLDLSACCALAPPPEESSKKFVVGLQSSKFQKACPLLSGVPPPSTPLPPKPRPPEPPVPPDLPAAPVPPSVAATVSAELCVAAAETPPAVVGVPIVVTPDGSPTIALVSGSVYSSLVCAAKRGSTGGGPSQPLSAVAPTTAVAA